MLKLPAGYGCDAGDATDENGGAARQQQPRGDAQQHQYHNLPVAVAVPLSGIPNLQRQRSLNGPGGNGSGGAPVRRKTAHQFSFRSLTGSEFIRLADFAGKVRPPASLSVCVSGGMMGGACVAPPTFCTYKRWWTSVRAADTCRLQRNEAAGVVC